MPIPSALGAQKVADDRAFFADGVQERSNILKIFLTVAVIVVALGTVTAARCVKDSSGVVTCRSSESFLARRGAGSIKLGEFGAGAKVDSFGRPVLHKPRELQAPKSQGFGVYSDQNGKRVVCTGKGEGVVCN